MEQIIKIINCIKTKYCFFILTLVLCCCKSKNINTTSTDKIFIKDYNFESDFFQLKQSLENNLIPEFLKDSCFRINRSYSNTVNSDMIVDYTMDLLDSLPPSLFKILSNHKDSNSLKIICANYNNIKNNIPFYRKSVWQVIQHRCLFINKSNQKSISFNLKVDSNFNFKNGIYKFNRYSNENFVYLKLSKNSYSEIMFLKDKSLINKIEENKLSTKKCLFNYTNDTLSIEESSIERSYIFKQYTFFKIINSDSLLCFKKLTSIYDNIKEIKDSTLYIYVK